MSLRRPNVFLIGSMKSGTTYLSGLLAEHPAVFMSSPREPCHFLDPKVLIRVWPWAWEQGYWRSTERYLSLFADAGDAAVIAEASTFYSQVPLFPQVPERILQFNPDARFIYVMRDPIERTISHYWHCVRWWGERRSMLEAIRSDPWYGDVSHYARQLNAYLQHVARERLCVLTHEALLAEPAAELRRLYAWLGVEPSFRPSTLGVPDNVLPEVIYQVRGLGLLDRFRRNARYRAVAGNIPRALRQLGSALIPRRPIRPADVDTSAVESFLRPQLQQQTEELARLLNRRFPEWQTLYAREPLAGEALTA